jgi:hypothetical protein
MAVSCSFATLSAAFAVAALLALRPAAAFAAGTNIQGTNMQGTNMQGMNMPMNEGPARFPVPPQIYSSHKLFLLKLEAIPKPIPFEKYFTISFAVYDGHHPQKRLSGAKVTIFAGMRHGLSHGFAHDMQSSPKLSEKAGIVSASGMYFHMMGRWTLKVTIRDGGKEDVAYLKLPCCDK